MPYLCRSSNQIKAKFSNQKRCNLYSYCNNILLMKKFKERKDLHYIHIISQSKVLISISVLVPSSNLYLLYRILSESTNYCIDISRYIWKGLLNISSYLISVIKDSLTRLRFCIIKQRNCV